MKKNFSVTRVPFRVSLILSCLFFASLSAYAAPPQEVTIPCPDKDHTPIQMPTGQGNLLRAKGDLTPWKFALVPATDVHVQITKDWKFSGQDAEGHVVDQGWGAFVGGGKTLSLSWNSALMPGTFTVTVSFKRWCGGANGPGVGPPADIPEETLQWGGSVLGVEITDSAGHVITTKQTVCVGQQIKLGTKILPNGSPNGLTATYKWTIPTTTLYFYINGQLNPYVDIDKDKASTMFYWFDGADNQTVSVECTVDGQKFTDSVQFDVKAPTMDEFTSTTGQVEVNVFDPGKDDQIRLLTGREITRAGLKWSAKATAPALFSGQFKFTQVLRVDAQRTVDTQVNKTEGTTESFKIPAWWCDATEPYANALYPATGGTQITMDEQKKTSDSPNFPLEKGYKKMEVKFTTFKLYLMFQPNIGPDAIWIPLGKIAWGWKGVATGIANGQLWNLTSGNFYGADPNGAAIVNPNGTAIIGTNTLDFPQYDDQVAELHPDWVQDAGQ